MLTKQNLCRHVVFSQNCWFVANFVDKALVENSTSRTARYFNTSSADNLFIFLIIQDFLLLNWHYVEYVKKYCKQEYDQTVKTKYLYLKTKYKVPHII